MGKRPPLAERRKAVLDIIDAQISADATSGDHKEAEVGRAVRAAVEELFDFCDNVRRIADAAEARKADGN